MYCTVLHGSNSARLTCSNGCTGTLGMYELSVLYLQHYEVSECTARCLCMPKRAPLSHEGSRARARNWAKRVLEGAGVFSLLHGGRRMANGAWCGEARCAGHSTLQRLRQAPTGGGTSNPSTCMYVCMYVCMYIPGTRCSALPPLVPPRLAPTGRDARARPTLTGANRPPTPPRHPPPPPRPPPPPPLSAAHTRAAQRAARRPPPG